MLLAIQSKHQYVSNFTPINKLGEEAHVTELETCSLHVSNSVTCASSPSLFMGVKFEAAKVIQVERCS